MKNLVVIDGSNFYHRAKDLFPIKHLTDFNYLKLIQDVTGGTDNNIEYCIGEIKRDPASPKSEDLYREQQVLFYALEKQGITIKKGFMLKTNGVYSEKGVDVRIAVDILRGALKNEYNICYVISSDTDLIPAIKEARDVGKQIIYVGFEGIVSRAMSLNCSKSVIISKKMLDACYAPKPIP